MAAMTELQWTAAVLGAGLGSYVLRAAPFWYAASREFGQRHLRCLTYISFAVASGIVSRSIFLSGGDLALGRETWIKLLAVVIALGLYRVSRSTPVSLFSAVAIAVLINWASAPG